MLKGLICVLGLAAVTASAQEFEVGVLGGFGYAPKVTVSNATTSADTGLKNGPVIGVFGGADDYRYFGGEASYVYRKSNFTLDNGSKSADFSGHTHLITGDILGYFRPIESRMRPFISFGGGIEIFQGTGHDSPAPPPLNTLAALTSTRELVPVGEIGVGVKYQLSKFLRFRAQVRDYISPVPNDVISPLPAAHISGILNDIVGTVGLSLTW